MSGCEITVGIIGIIIVGVLGLSAKMYATDGEAWRQFVEYMKKS